MASETDPSADAAGDERSENREDAPGEDAGGRIFRSAAARRSAVLRALALVGGLLVVTLLVTVAVPELTDPAWVRDRIAAFGVWAPVAFVVLETVQVILAPIPGQLLGGVGGYLFGGFYGTLYALVGVGIGSAIVFVLARRYGRPYVERVIDPATLDRWDEFVRETGVPGLFVLFLLPTFPDDALCFVAGLSTIRLRTFLVLVVLGRGPSFLAVAYAGGQLADGQVGSFLTLVSVVGVLSLAVYVLRDGLMGAIEQVVGTRR